MFKKSERLSRKNFGFFFKNGRRITTNHFTLIITKHNKTMVSVVVGRSVSGLAVVRNKIKRQVLSQLRNFFKQTDLKAVCIVIIKDDCLKLIKTEINQILNNHFLKKLK